MTKASLRKLARATWVLLLVPSSVAFLDRYWYFLTVPRSTQEDDIRQAALNQGLGEQLAGCGKDGNICCLSLQGKHDPDSTVSFEASLDPSDSFLARFHGQFKKGSDCAIDLKKRQYFDTKSVKPATLVEIGRVQWYSRTGAHIKAQFHCGELCGMGGLYDMRWEHGDYWFLWPLETWFE